MTYDPRFAEEYRKMKVRALESYRQHMRDPVFVAELERMEMQSIYEHECYRCGQKGCVYQKSIGECYCPNCKEKLFPCLK